jgi:hypothetical protein
MVPNFCAQCVRKGGADMTNLTHKAVTEALGELND